MAFDAADRGILIEAMQERGIRERVTERCKDVLREIKSRMRAEGMLGKNSGWKGKCLESGIISYFSGFGGKVEKKEMGRS